MKSEVKQLSLYDLFIANARGIIFSAAMAVIIAISAQAGFMTPFSPVPVTLQTLAVIAAGLFLGPVWGTMSVLWYLAIGFMGAPVFAMGLSGPAIVLQPSFGYLLGFPLAAWLSGSLAARYGKGFVQAVLYGFAGIVVIYLTGIIWLTGSFTIAGSPFISSLKTALVTGTLPFIFIDLLKIVLAAGLWGLITKYK